MSIHDEIRKRLGKELFVLPPQDGSIQTIRTMIVSKEVYYDVQPDSWGDNWDGFRLAQFRGTLDTFTEGRRISVGEKPYKKHPGAFMARTDPVAQHIFDIRSLDPRPGIRCLGGFFEKDGFLALSWEYHDYIEGKKAWAEVIERSRAQWQTLFNETKPQLGDDLDACLSNYQVV